MIRNYLRFVKIEHTLFSLPVVFSGSFLALSQSGGHRTITPWQFLWIFLAVLGARSAGFGMNRIVDRELDRENPRTQGRELPAGKIDVRSAWLFVLVSAILYLAAAGMLSKLCLYLSPVPLALFYLYPYLKRWTLWSHLGLGIAWGVAPIGGWLAVRPELEPLAQMLPVFLLALFCVFWVGGFDIIYALLDEDFDRERKLRSMPAVLGRKNALRVSELFHCFGLVFLGSLVQLYLNHPVSFLFLGAVGLLLVVSHWKVQFEPLSPPVIDFAFFKVNAVLGFVVFLLIYFHQMSCELK